MSRRVTSLAGAFLLMVALLAVSPAPVGADADQLLADWQMNEGVGATVMTDSSGNGIDGAIGAAVVTGQSVMGATAYHWSNTNPNQPPPKPERLILIDDDRLNPGSDDYAVTVRFRTTRPFGNIVQKGQAGAIGGNWKWQMPSGKLVCNYRGFDQNGNELLASVNSGDEAFGFSRLDDGEWHVARCERRADRVILTIDPGTPNERVRRALKPTGTIANNVPMTIGGKLNCDQVEITCDYFVGEIDYVIVETGPRGPVNIPPLAFADGSCDFLDCDFTAAGSYDPDGTIASYSWDFGDGTTGTGLNVSHTYDDPGTYVATLLISDDGGATDTETVTVVATSEPPVASFTSSCDFRLCSFDGSASFDPDGSVVSYSWDFGDGSSATGAMPLHTYAAPGSYTVELTVIDNDGGAGSATDTITATNESPVAVFDVECNFQVCDFDATGSYDPDGSIVGYSWDFGDGTSGTGAAPQHTYVSAGRYTATVTVTDNHGGMAAFDGPVVTTDAPVVHLHDLKPSPYDVAGNKWVARVIVKVRGDSNNPVAGVEVDVDLGNKSRSCVTNAAGKCKAKVKVADSRPKLPAEVTAVSWVGGYDPAANKDKDGDGDGETVLIRRPF